MGKPKRNLVDLMLDIAMIQASIDEATDDQLAENEANAQQYANEAIRAAA